MSAHLHQFLADSARRCPDSTALVCDAGQLTYSELYARSVQVSRLFAEAGLRRGSHVIVLSTNNVSYVATYHACSMLGLILVPVNAHLQPAEIAWILEDSAPSAALVESPFIETFEQAADLADTTSVKRFISGDTRAGWTEIDAIPSPATQLPEYSPGPDSQVVQMYTSGTTGRPKGVMLSQANVASMVETWVQEISLTHENSRFLHVMPLFHVGGLLHCLCPLAAGATLYLQPKFEPGAALATMREADITDTILVPAMLQRLLAACSSETSFPHLRQIIYGASLTPPTLLHAAKQRFDCDFTQGYGLTETSGIVLCLQGAEHDFSGTPEADQRLTAAGRAVACAEAKIVDPEGREVSPGALGEIFVRGSNIMLGYWNNPEATDQAFAGDWLATGDLGRADHDGLIYVVGRAKDMIDYSGENVYPAEVENILNQHPAVAEVAVIGLPHARTGEEVVGVIVLHSASNTNATEAALAELCEINLARFKRPSRYVFVDQLPRTPAGKVQKHLLQEELS